MMFSKTLRLPGNTRVINSQTYHSSSFILKVSKNSTEDNRYGFVASKKVSPLATSRNELKRRFRAVVESSHPSLKKGYDMLFIFKKEAIGKTHEDFENELHIIPASLWAGDKKFL